MTIVFAEHNGKETPALPLTEFTDRAIEQARDEYERANGPLPNGRTGFPSFTVYDDDGNELGGG